MQPTASPAARPAAPSVVLVVAVLYAAAECFRQLALQSPPGVPGDTGVSFWTVLALAICAVVGPALLVGIALRGRPQAADRVAVAGAAWLLASAVIWRGLDRAGVLVEPSAPGPLFFLLPGLVVALVAGWLAGPVLRRWPLRLRGPVRVLGGVVLVALVGLGVGLRTRVDRSGGPAEGPNFLLVTIDTLRRDALGAYGGPATALDSLGAVAHLAWSVSSWTQPAMASLFSGVIPTGHGSDAQHGPDPAVQWWPEALGRAQSAAFVTNPYLRRRFGFNRGFGTFDHGEERPWLEPVARTVLAEWCSAILNARAGSDRADTVVHRAQKWLRGTDPDRPWFLWVHLLDPHLPYTLRGEQGATAPAVTPDWVRPLAGQYEGRGFADLRGVRAGESVTTDAERVALRRLYQSGVDYAAWWTRALIATATAVSADRELKWLVTSDHGEEFFEEGGFEHGHQLNAAVLAIPMLSSGLGPESRNLRLTDVGPWVLDALHCGAGFVPRTGTQLLDEDAALFPLALGAIPGALACDPPPLIAEGLLYGPPQTLVVQADGSRWLRAGGASVPELVDQCSADAAVCDHALWEQLDFWRDRRTRSPLDMGVDADLRRQLRALGYTH